MWRISIYQEGNEYPVEKHAHSFEIMWALAHMDPAIDGAAWKGAQRAEVQDHFRDNTLMHVSWIDDMSYVVVQKLEWVIYYHKTDEPLLIEPCRRLEEAWLRASPSNLELEYDWHGRSLAKVTRDFHRRGRSTVVVARLDDENWTEIRRVQMI